MNNGATPDGHTIVALERYDGHRMVRRAEWRLSIL